MDPISQAAVGAIAAQLGSQRKNLMPAAVLGAIGGMVPDLDVLIRSSTDPLLTLEYHRQITHSFFAIPVLGSVLGLVAFALFGKRWGVTLPQTLLWCTLGVATHGLLDGCTSYGTQLLWPLSEERFAWDLISVVDPLFTVPLLLLIMLSLRRREGKWPLFGVSWMLVYLGIGYFQHQRVIDAGYALANERNHQVQRLEAKPSFGNLVVWKLIYETPDYFFVDAIKPGWQQPTVWPGAAVEKLNLSKSHPWLATRLQETHFQEKPLPASQSQESTQQQKDIERFAKLSENYVAVDPANPNRIFDVRYSMLPDQINPMWGLSLSREKLAQEHADFFTERENGRDAANRLLEMIFQ